MGIVYFSGCLFITACCITCVLLIKSRGIRYETSRKGIAGVFERLGYYAAGSAFFRKHYKKTVEGALKILHPAREPQELCREYYGEKIALCIPVILAGLLLAVLIAYNDQKESILQDGNRLRRGGYFDEEQEVELIITDPQDGNSRKLTYALSPRSYSDAELDEFAKKFEEDLPGIILGENESPQKVIRPLKLQDQYEDYPFSVEWMSEDYSLVDDDGSVYNEELTAPKTVLLTADLSYREKFYEVMFSVTVHPKVTTQAEREEESLQKILVREDKKQLQEEFFRLPDRLLGKKVTYRMLDAEKGVMYPFIVLILVLVLYFLKDRDLSDQLRRRQYNLEAAYPDFTEKFVLLFGAGMNVRNIFLRIGRDENLAPELKTELALLARDLGNGIMEYEAYDRFAVRTGSRLYVKLISLLIQNQKKGNTEMMKMLEEAAKDAFVVRKNQARKKGEETGTKLLIPMIMLLGVVMVVIIMPAFLSF